MEVKALEGENPLEGLEVLRCEMTCVIAVFATQKV